MSYFKEKLKQCKWDNIVIALLTLALGILCLIFPHETGNTLVYVFGVLAMVIAILLFVRSFYMVSFLSVYSLSLGIVLLSVGIFTICFPNFIKALLPFFFGLYIVVDSASSLAESVQYGYMKVRGWWLLMVSSILTIIFGVVVMMFANFDDVMILAGIALIVESVRRFIFTFTVEYKIKRLKKDVKDAIDVEIIDK